jgi:hypothetical protein
MYRQATANRTLADLMAHHLLERGERLPRRYYPLRIVLAPLFVNKNTLKWFFLEFG